MHNIFCLGQQNDFAKCHTGEKQDIDNRGILVLKDLVDCAVSFLRRE